MSGNAYWAAASPDEIGSEIAARVKAYYEFVRVSPLFRRIGLARRLMFGLDNKQGAVSWEVRRGGLQGELAKLRVGHFGNLAEQRVVLATQQRPAWSPIATNSDFASLAQATTVAGVLDYTYREQRLDRRLLTAMRDIQWAGEGFTLGGWDARKGPMTAADPDTGETFHQGDLVFKSPTTLDVVRDPYASSWESTTWRIPRVFVNKYDLAARYPEKEEEICGLGGDWLDSVGVVSDHSQVKSDEIPLFHFFHDKTDALPEGRYVLFASPSVVLFDGPLPYRGSPLKRATEKELPGTPFGWTAMFDCLGPQEVVDALTTAIVTQQTTNAVRKLIGVKGSGINWRQITQALGVIEVKSMDQAPKPLDFADVSPQVFEFRKGLIQEMQMFSNVNDVQRGVVNENIKSGAHAALYDAISLRSAGPLNAAYYGLAEDLGTFTLHTLSDYAADSERTASIIGEHNRQLVHTFKGSELAGFDRVVVEATNHNGKTALGKQAWADALLEKGALGQNEIAGQRYIQLAKTGELEQMTEAPQSNALRIKRDKELLAKGIGLPPLAPVVDPLTGLPAVDPMTGAPQMKRQPAEGQTYVGVHVAQTHWLDIPEYLAVLSTPEAMENPAVVSAVLETVQEKLNLWRTMDPDLLALLGGPVPPSQSMTLPPAPGAQAGTPRPKGGAPTKTPPPQGGNAPAPDMPAKPAGLPHMPNNGPQHAPDGAGVLPQ